MKNKIIMMSVTVVAVLILIVAIIVGNINKKSNEGNSNKTKILTSFYPIYLMTLNITNGAESVEVSNMAEHQSGCIHDYTLSTSDLKKFENADIFIQNGEGLENFSKKIIDSYPNVKVISAAENISDFIKAEDGDVNSHVWMSLKNYISEVKEISEKLSTLDEKNAQLYNSNYEKYLSKLNELKNDETEVKEKNTDKSVLCLNESLEYLLNEVGFKVLSVETDHEQSALSAKQISDIIEEMKEKNITSIFIDENDSDKTASTIAKETGAQIYRLNSAMSGENDNDAFIKIMKNNLDVIRNIK